MTTHNYLNAINKRFKSGISREHAYRHDLEALLRQLAAGVEVTNEPANVTDCGNPDYVLTRGKIPLGYIEAKDIGKDLNAKQYKKQFTRYKKALDNLIITDYLWFQFFQNGDLIHEIRIGKIVGEAIEPIPENLASFETLIQNFCAFVGQTIKSPKKLAELMAAKARLLQNILASAIASDEKTEDNTALKAQYEAFKQVLIHDLQPAEFADIYAQTLAYGLFAARLHDPSLDSFNRHEAAELIPKTNPFLRKLFQYVAGYDIDERLKTTVDNLADVFRATNVADLLHNFGQSAHDPIIHFYETFLAEYDPKLRKARGVWYTPEPVVNFMVRAVDDLLKSEFGLPRGLADTAKTTIKVKTQTPDKRAASGYREIEREVHRVQILDPAAGTGTFLAEVVKHIYRHNFQAMQGAWSSYVEQDLIPRLYGFELLMASYAMAHLKLDMLLGETGYQPHQSPRFNIYLTNSLEEHHPDTGTLFASWLSTEANQANHIKRDTPVMVVLGNPPYSGESANKGDWILKMMDDFKKEPGGKKKLQEKTSKWLNDDYVKFIRYGQYFIEKNQEGILAFINNHAFLDNPTFRGMRWHLLRTFDQLYVIDLHGNAKKKETCPDRSKDENVFDIQQGVSINIFVKTGKKNPNELGKVFHFDLFGLREFKYKFLQTTDFNIIKFNQVKLQKPFLFFSSKDFSAFDQYDNFFSINELFLKSGNGVVTKRDNLAIQDTPTDAINSATDILNLKKEDFYQKYKLPEDVRDWKYEWAKKDIRENFKGRDTIQEIFYRPFDKKYIAYTGNSRGFIGWPVYDIMHNYIGKQNIGLLVSRMTKGLPFAHCFVTNRVSEAIFLSSITSTNAFNHPLYLYPKNNVQQPLDGNQEKRTPNLNLEIVRQFASKIDLTFTPEKETTTHTFAPIDLLDYIYAVLHSPTYREKYQDFLSVDFPRVPYPANPAAFWQLVNLGGQLRQLHLLEAPAVENFRTQYPAAGDNVITRKLTGASPGFELTDPAHQTGKVWLNDRQYFDTVPLAAWEFYIGGYQPAQKWLKDRVGRQLSYDDIRHYQKIIVALSATGRIMQEIDQIELE